MLRQIWKTVRLLGLGRAVRMKRHHEQGLEYVRGYAGTRCWWALLTSGFLDELAAKGMVRLGEYARRRGCEERVLRAVVEYLDGIGLLERRGEEVRLSEEGAVLLAEPRGLFELAWAYERCFVELPGMLTGQKRYGREVVRDVTYVGIGSGRLCEQMPYPVMRRMVLEHGGRVVCDLGCGDMGLMAGLCRMDEGIRCHGIDSSAEMIAFDREQLARGDYGGRLTVQEADMFGLGELPAELGTVDCITACDTFHEYLDEPGRLVELLKELRGRFEGALFVIGEFCLQDAAWLRRHRTASLEHHLFHDLSNQRIGTAGQWREIFGQAGLRMVEEQVYDLIGHGYFALK